MFKWFYIGPPGQWTFLFKKTASLTITITNSSTEKICMCISLKWLPEFNDSYKRFKLTHLIKCVTMYWIKLLQANTTYLLSIFGIYTFYHILLKGDVHYIGQGNVWEPLHLQVWPSCFLKIFEIMYFLNVFWTLFIYIFYRQTDKNGFVGYYFKSFVLHWRCLSLQREGFKFHNCFKLVMWPIRLNQSHSL